MWSGTTPRNHIGQGIRHAFLHFTRVGIPQDEFSDDRGTHLPQNTRHSSQRGAARIKWPDGQMQRQWFDVDDQWFHTFEGHC